MKFIKQNILLPVKNLDTQFEDKSSYKRHSILLPSSIRCVICGPSNCGKTNVMLILIESPNGLKFENVYIFSKSLHQSKYVWLSSVLEKIEGIGYYPFSENSEIVHPNDTKNNSIYIFDDICCDKQEHMKE